jgi:hypothetical protein
VTAGRFGKHLSKDRVDETKFCDAAREKAAGGPLKSPQFVIQSPTSIAAWVMNPYAILEKLSKSRKLVPVSQQLQLRYIDR